MEGREETREGEWASKLIKLLWIKNSVWGCNYSKMPDAVSFSHWELEHWGKHRVGWMDGRHEEKETKNNNNTRAAKESFIKFSALMKP